MLGLVAEKDELIVGGDLWVHERFVGEKVVVEGVFQRLDDLLRHTVDE